MRIKKRGESVTPFNAIEVLLKNRGIKEEDIDHIINPTSLCELHYNYKNMDEAVQLYKNTVLMNNNSIIGILVDADCDGFTSASLLYMYIYANYPEIKLRFYTHSKKTHGLTQEVLDKVISEEEKVDILFVLDAGSGDFNGHRRLRDNGIECIVLDHHACSRYSEDAIVVNNQMNQGGNKTLTGVGMTYKFIQHLDKKKAKKYLDIVAIGQIADVSDCKNLETRYLVNEGIKLMNKGKYSSKFIQELVKYKLKDKAVSIMGIGFYIAPLINSAIRMGDSTTNNKLFLALTTDKDDYTEDLEMCKGLKETQDLLSEEGFVTLKKQVEDCKLDNYSVIVCNGSEVYPGIKGLIANKIAQEYSRPTLVLAEKDGILKGSARGSSESTIKDFKKFISEFAFNKLVEGHSQAFGYHVAKENVEQLYKFISTVPISKVEKEIVVDDIYSAYNLDRNLINTVHSYEHLWGNGVAQPLFYIENILVNSSQIFILGEDERTIKFSCEGVEYIKFKVSKEEKDELDRRYQSPKNWRFVLTGRFSVNTFRGNSKPQVLIDKWEYTESDFDEIPF